MGFSLFFFLFNWLRKNVCPANRSLCIICFCKLLKGPHFIIPQEINISLGLDVSLLLQMSGWLQSFLIFIDRVIWNFLSWPKNIYLVSSCVPWYYLLCLRTDHSEKEDDVMVTIQDQETLEKLPVLHRGFISQRSQLSSPLFNSLIWLETL